MAGLAESGAELLAVLALAFAGTQAQPLNPDTVTRAQVQDMPVDQLAQRLLDNERARRILHFTVGAPTFAGGRLSWIRFEEAPRSAPQEMCAQTTHFVSFRPAAGYDAHSVSSDAPSLVERVEQRPRVGLGSVCREGPGAELASIWGAEEADGLMVLRRLVDARAAAAGRAALRFTVACEDETDAGLCAAGPRAALARLPLEGIFSVSAIHDERYKIVTYSRTTPNGTRSAVVTLDPSRPPRSWTGWTVLARARHPAGVIGPVWTITLSPADGETRRIRLHHAAPAPF